MVESTYPTAEETRIKLSKNFTDNDLGGFKANYTAYLEQFPEYRDRKPKIGDDSVPSVNYMLNDKLAVGGHPINFRLKSTDKKEVAEILDNGRAAQKVFSELSVDQRLKLIDKIEAKFKQYESDIALTITADTTKPIDMSAKEMTKANEWFKYARDNAKKQLGLVDSEGKQISDIQSHPALGMTQVIPAGNYPVALAIGPAVGALVSGNSVTISFPDKALNTAGPVMKAFREAVSEFSRELDIDQGKKDILNKGLVQYTIGRNDLYKEADIVSFVGSNKVGESMKKERGDKPTILEMGGNNVVAVMNSAVTKEGKTPEENAKTIAQVIYEGFGPLSGQRCTGPRRLCPQIGEAEMVVSSLKDTITKGPKAGAGGIGNSFEKGIVIGTLIDDAAYNKINRAMHIAGDCGYGKFNANDSDNKELPKNSPHFANPVLIDVGELEKKRPEKAKELMKLLGDGETFGPLILVTAPVKGLPEMIDYTKTNDKHKLAGAIFTASEDDFKKYKAETGVNSVVWNGAPKDPSPVGMHGTKGEAGVGGEHHFANFTTAFHELHPKTEGLREGSYVRSTNQSRGEAAYAR